MITPIVNMGIMTISNICAIIYGSSAWFPEPFSLSEGFHSYEEGI